MKKMFLVLSIFFILLLISCNSPSTPVDTNKKEEEPSEKITIENIVAVDKDGKTVERVSAYVSLEPIEYTHEGIFIWAIYSDQSHEDITQKCDFSSVDLTKKGTTKVTVTYESFTTSYTLELSENNVTSIEIDYRNCEIIYRKGSIVNTDGLAVQATYADDTTRTIKNYSLELRRDGQTYPITQSLSQPGTYKVYILYQSLEKSYDIRVYDSLPTKTYHFKTEQLLDNVVLDSKGSYTYTSLTTVECSNLAKLSFNGTKIVTKTPTNEAIQHYYDKEIYTAHMTIPQNKGIQIILPSKTHLFIVVGNLYGAQIVLKNGSNEYKPFGHFDNYTSTLYAELDAGTYDLVSDVNSCILYGITFYGTSSNTTPTEPVTPPATKTITFGYSGPSVPLNTWEQSVTLPIDYSSCIRVPSSDYVFLGFSPTFEDDHPFVKVYVDRKRTSGCLYVYVTPRLEYISSDTTDSQPTPPAYMLNSGEEFDHYELDEQRSTATYKFYIAVCNQTE